MNNQDITTKLDGVVDAIISTITASLSAQIRDLVLAEVQKQVGVLSSAVLTGTISGNQINGGIITEFGSTGIDDRATACVLTLLDESVVIENNLLTRDLTVQGNLAVRGMIDESSPFFMQITNAVTKNLAIVEKPSLPAVGADWVSSVPAALGPPQGLQSAGECLLDSTLYVSDKKVGINTIAPTAALTIRDAEAELRIGKLRYGTVQIVAPGNQNLILSSNFKPNIILADDGSTLIEELYVGGPVKITSASSPPRGDGEKGHIVFNANPSKGGPMGWVCLGADTWANLATID